MSEGDGIPVLLKHLPEWESVRDRATFTNSLQDVKTVLGPRPVLERIEFAPGTEAVTAPYPAGRLLIIEYQGPQTSVETDTRVNQYLAETGGNADFVYRRIGNYNAFVFDPADTDSAPSLLAQVKYEKHIQWLGVDPFARNRAERNFVVTTSDIFLSTVLVILLGVAVSVVGGLIAGLVYFLFRERRRAGMSEYTDAGGMTRLNLDRLTPDLSPRLLND